MIDLDERTKWAMELLDAIASKRPPLSKSHYEAEYPTFVRALELIMPLAREKDIINLLGLIFGVCCGCHENTHGCFCMRDD